MAKEYGLLYIVQDDGSLERDEKQAYVSLAKLYEQDFNKNLELTSLELDEKYKTDDPHLWQKFLSHVSVSNYIENYLLERADKQALISLGDSKNAAKAMKSKEYIDKKKRKDDNSKIIVMLLPSKGDFGL